MTEQERNSLKQLALDGAEAAMPRLLELLKNICSLDSGTGNEAGNQAVIDLLLPVLNELGAVVEPVHEPGLGTHLVARVRPQGQAPKGKILLIAHLDTVFAEGFAAQHPFRIEGDWVHGLGSGDCKSGVLIALFSTLLLKQAGKLPPWEITFLFTCDEEIGSGSGSKVYQQESRDADYALILESAKVENGKSCFTTQHSGVILGTIDVTGKEAHAGVAYLEGRSAILELAHQIIHLYSFNELDRGIYYNVAPITGGRPNGIVAGQAHAEFCVAGIPTNADFPIIEKKLDSLAQNVTVDGCTVRVAYHTLFPSMEKSEANHRAYLLVEQAARLLGLDPVEGFDPGATDAAYVSTYGVPSVDSLSAITTGIHTVEEKVCISSIQERLALCTLILGTLE